MLKNRIKYSIIIILFLIVAYAVLPVSIPSRWNKNIKENAILGKTTQSTGGDFEVEKQVLKSSILKPEISSKEVILTGNTPYSKYIQNYEILMSRFILYGEIVGTKEIDTEEYYVFDVEKYRFAEYVPRLWISPLYFIYIFITSAIALFVFTMYSTVRFLIIRHRPVS